MSALRRCAAVLACFAVLGAAAQPQPPSLVLEDLTWPELRDAISAGKTTVLVPIGGTEQNGPHIVLGKHNARVWELSGRIAADLGNALIAPEIAYVPEGTIDPPSGHMKFPGTVSIPEDAFEKTLEGVARSLRRHGFRDIVFLGDHGGYRRNLHRVADRLNKEWGGAGARVHPLPEYYVELPHAGKDDTSLSLAMKRFALVRRDQVAKAADKSSGAAADPAGASLEAGLVLYEAIVKRTVESIKKAVARK
ncbi:MAG TPA: creatininase family protein [Usitatibacter sp.]|nr:creatininase family protein [Usitatibacter sp.]